MTTHTPGRVTFKEDGDANHWSMLTKDGRWLLAILANGEQTSERQIANFRRLAACWNACDGIDTELLDPKILGNQIAAKMGLIEQRDDLLEAAEKALNECCDLIATPAGDALRAAIAKATGGAA